MVGPITVDVDSLMMNATQLTTYIENAGFIVIPEALLIAIPLLAICTIITTIKQRKRGIN